MIEVVNRELLIPREEFNIGTNYDTNSEARIFHMKRVTSGGVDLANLSFVLDLRYANDKADTAALVKEATDKDINLSLSIVKNMLQVPGSVIIQIRALNADGNVKWTSYPGAFFVEDAINTPAEYTGKLTELERFEADYESYQRAEAGRVAAEEKRVTAETDRESGETARESAFNAAIADFNNDRQELKDFRNLSESYAHGNTGVREGENTDNSKYYADQAQESFENTVFLMNLTIPSLHVDFTTGDLMYTQDVSAAGKVTVDFNIDTSTGDLMYEISTI